MSEATLPPDFQSILLKKPVLSFESKFTATFLNIEGTWVKILLFPWTEFWVKIYCYVENWIIKSQYWFKTSQNQRFFMYRVWGQNLLLLWKAYADSIFSQNESKSAIFHVLRLGSEFTATLDPLLAPLEFSEADTSDIYLIIFCR